MTDSSASQADGRYSNSLTGVTIEVDKHWWGYVVKLNQDAVDNLDQCLTLLDESLKYIFHDPAIREAVSLAIQLKQKRLQNVADATGRKGCNLVSPWIMPFALAVVRNTGGGDQNLWYSVWDQDKNEWGEQSEFNDHQSRSGPALAQHGDKLYCVHRAEGNDQDLYWTTYTTNDGWSDDHKMDGHLTSTTPCLVEFNKTLYCFHRGHEGDKTLYSCKLNDDGTWSDDMKIMVGNDVHYAESGCAAAVFNKKLYLVYEGSYAEHMHVISSDDGSTWGGHIEFQDYTTGDTPALVVYHEKLLLVHRGAGSNKKMYYMTTSDGVSWSKDLELGGEHLSNQGPGLAVFDDKVYMVHRSHMNDGTLWYSIYDGNSWSPDVRIEGQSTAETPALACYTDPQCTPENYVDPKDAAPRLICVHRGWGN